MTPTTTHPDLMDRDFASVEPIRVRVTNFVCHEALLNRVEARDRIRPVVRGSGVKLRAA